MDNGVTINRPPRDGHMAFVRSPDNISIGAPAGGRIPAARRTLGVDAEHGPLVRTAALLLGAGRLASPRRSRRRRSAASPLCSGLDVSASVDAAEYRLQVEGLAASLIHPSVVEAALSGNGPVGAPRSTNGRGGSSRTF